MMDILPPDSVYPRIHDMVRPSKNAMGFPDIPAVLASANPDAPNNFIQAMRESMPERLALSTTGSEFILGA